MFRNQTKALLWAGFGGLIALMGALGITAISFLSEMDARHERNRMDFVARTRILESLRSDLYLSGTHIRDFLFDSGVTASVSDQQSYSETKARVQDELSQYGQYLRAEEVDTYRTLDQGTRSYLGTLDSALQWSPTERRAKGTAFIPSEMLPRRAATLTLTDHIERLNENRLEASGRETSELFALFRARLLGLVALMLTLGLLLAGISLWRILQLERESETRFAEIERARSELRSLSARVLRAQEDERRQVARELHDEVGQALWAISLGIDNLGAVLQRGDTELALQQLAALHDISDNSVRVVRNMSLLLRPSMLDDLGLLPALKWLAREMSRTSNLHVEVNAEQLPDDLPEEHKTCVFRVVQEALRNSSRHAGAHSAWVYARVSSGKLMLTVRDEGAGFDPQREKGLGLLVMEDRAHHLGVALQIQSGAVRGTIVAVQLPLPDHPKEGLSVESVAHEIRPLRTA